MGLALIVFVRKSFSFEGDPYDGIVLMDLAFALILAVLVAFIRYHFKSMNSAGKPELKIIWHWPHERTDTLIGIAAVAGIVGAKLFDGLENWSSYVAHPSDFFAFSGLTFYGGLIIATVAILYYAHQKHIDKWQLSLNGQAHSAFFALQVKIVHVQLSL